MTAEPAYCAKCGMPVVRDWAGWTHKLPPMSATERRRYRHVVTVLRFGTPTKGDTAS